MLCAHISRRVNDFNTVYELKGQYSWCKNVLFAVENVWMACKTVTLLLMLWSWNSISSGLGDGTSQNDVYPYQCSGTPGPQINRPLWPNVPGLIHLCHYAFQKVLVGAKWQECINAGTLCFQDNSSRGPGVPEHSQGDTSFRDVPSPHPPVFCKNLITLGFTRSK